MIVKGSKVGLLIRTDAQYYGARQAFKVYGAKRGHAYGPWSVNGIGPTKSGICDRLLVMWGDGSFTYENSGLVEIVR
jgi:hypothetical protein